MALEWKKHVLLVPPTDAEMAQMEPQKLADLYEMYHDAIENAERDPYRFGFALPNWLEADEQLTKYNEVLVSGGNRCLAGEQVIFDPVAQKSLRVDSITEAFHVFAWDEQSKRFVIALAEKPFQKPVQRLYRLSLSNGRTLSCSGAHLVLTPSGWKAVESLAVGSYICGSKNNPSELPPPAYGQSQPPSTSGISREASQQDVLRWSQIAQGSLGNYQPYRHFCDEQPQSAIDCVQEISPSPNDALGYTFPYDSIYLRPSDDELRSLSSIQDGLAQKYGYSHFHQQCVHHSNLDDLLQSVGRFAGILCRSFCRLYTAASRLCVYLRCLLNRLQSFAVFLQQRFGWQFLQRDSLSRQFSYGGNSITCVSILAVDYLRDDTVWDFTVPTYHNYVAAGVISHNSSKTTWAARAVIKAALENRGSVIMCFSQNADVSIRQQQSAIYDALPVELRVKTLGTEANVSYTRKNGFSKGSLILPGSKSHIIFKTYAQFLNNDTILEGAELGSRDSRWTNIGAWCDEYLIGPELLATLRFRLATRDAKLIVTFTPIDGYTEVVRDYLEGAKTEKTRKAALLSGREVPVVQRSVNRDAGIIYFHSADNPFGGFERITEDLKGRPEEEILCRAYGIPTKSISTKFPLFNRAVNVVKHEMIPTKDVTRYMVLDPAGRKNWFMCWIAVDAANTYWVYREWPDMNVGDWAKWHQGKWIGGEGAKGLGYGIKDYVDMILRYEDNEKIFERLIDPRLGAAKYQGATGASSIIEDLADAGLVFVPAPGLEIEDGIQAIQTKMAYNRKEPISATNHPHFYISDRCENIITALTEYTGEGGPDEAMKDPVDVIRYACIDGIRFISDKATQRRTGGAY